MSTWDEWYYRNDSNTADELTEVLIQNQEYGYHADINRNGEPKYYPSNWSHRRLSSPGLFNPSKVNAESLDSIENVTESSSKTVSHSTLALHRDSIQLAAKRYKNNFRLPLVRPSLVSIDETHDHYGSQWFYSTASCVFEKGSRKLSTLLNLAPVHGHIINNAKGKNKIFWIIILILAAVGLLYEIINVTRQYVQTPTATEVNSEALRGIKFPTIVICSLNPLNKTWLRDEGVPLDLALYAQHVYMTTKMMCHRE